MNLWQNQLNDLGQPLTRQQRLLVSSGNNELRAYWFEFSLAELSLENIGVVEIEEKLKYLMQAHQALSTYYGIPDNFDVIRQQVQSPRLSFKYFDTDPVIEFTETVKQTLEQQAEQYFDKEQPHILAWCWLTADKLVLQIVASSLMLDHYSAYRLYQQLQTNHQRELESPMQYPEYIDWLNELLNDEDAQLGHDYWKSLALAQLSDARLSEQKPRSRQSSDAEQAKQTHKNVSMNLPQDIQVKLTQVAKQLVCTPADIVINVWAVLLGKLSNCDELKLDCYHDCRHSYQEFSTALGLFTQPLPIPFYHLNQADIVGACQGFTQLFEEIQDNQEYISSVDNLANTPCYAAFYWHQQKKLNEMSCNKPMASNGLLFDYLATEQDDGKFTLFYDNTRYDQAAMQRALAHFYVLLTATLAAPDQKMSRLESLLPDEKTGRFIAQNSLLSIHNLVEHQQFTTSCTSNLVSLFRAQAKKWPNSLAIRTNKESLTYQQLDQITDNYASALQTLGAKADTIIALCLPRATEFLVSLLAVLKSGAAYLPLDPEQPNTRLQKIIDDAKPIVLISELANLACNHCYSLNKLTQFEQPLQPTNIAPEHLAYVLYTSGSTGQPKGVQVEHRQIAHYSQAVIKQLSLPTQSHYGLISSLMADLGNTMLFPAWLTGSCLHLLDKNEANDGKVLEKYYQQHRLDCLKIVPSHLEALLASGKNILPAKVLVLGGEPIQPSLLEILKTLSPRCKLFNHYGPTETTVGVLIGEINLTTGQCNLTTAIGDNDILLLDDNMQPVISGQCAELYVSGQNVTRGYLNDLTLTNEVYLPSIIMPGNDLTNTKIYRTGDLAIRHADGSISIVGRNDQQIKIRGFRLDLNEIQQLLLSQQNITQATLQTYADGENKQLVAFVIVAKNQTIDEPALITCLRQHLPNYMVPAHVYALSEFPLNNNGKIDKYQLLNLMQAQQQQVFIAPENNLEKQILTIWQEVLQQQKLCVTADFFDIGGHSLAAIKVVAKIRQRLAIELPTDLIFQHKTIVDIASYINRNIQALSVKQDQRLIPLNKKAKANETSAVSEQTLILMHSLAGHFNYHQHFIKNLAEQYCCYGLTANAELLVRCDKNQIDIITDDYIEQLLPLKKQPLTLVGWSLGGKQMMLMAKRMLTLGFMIEAITLIDFDPAQHLHLMDNTEQLISDFKDYLAAENMNIPAETVFEITQSLEGNYQQAMQQLLNKPQIQTLLGQELSAQELQQRLMVRWQIKHMLYNAVMPQLKLPLWLWHGTGHKSPAQIWQQFTTLPLQSWYLDSDHYDILNRPELSSQLIDNIKQLTPMAIS